MKIISSYDANRLEAISPNWDFGIPVEPVSPSLYKIFIHKLVSNELVHSFELKDFPTQVEFSPDGKQFVTISQNGINLWDTNIGKLLTSHWDRSDEIIISPLWDKFVSTNGSGLSLWSLFDGELLAQDPDHFRPTDFVFSPDSETLAVGLFGGVVQLRQIHTGNVIKTFGLNARYSSFRIFTRW